MGRIVYDCKRGGLGLYHISNFNNLLSLFFRSKGKKHPCFALLRPELYFYGVEFAKADGEERRVLTLY